MTAAQRSIDERLRARADPSGFVPFDRFMEEALYAPGAGFYARARSPLGPRGDFYTAAHVHPMYARTLAHRVRQAIDQLPIGRPVVIAEVGPGDGRLAAGMLREFRARPPARADWSFRLVDRSEARASDAWEIARAAAGADSDRVSRSHGSVGEDGPFSGVVLAHELLDASPCRRFRWSHDRWHELGVRAVGPGWEEDARPVPDGVLLPSGNDLPDDPLVLEQQAGIDGFFREVGDHLVEGLVIVIDYGLEEAEMRSGHSLGTLASVAGHRAIDDPLERPGENDLSVFVDWTRAKAAAQRAGLALESDRPLAQALGAWGFEGMLGEALADARSDEERVRVQLAAKRILFGFERFRALEFGAGRPASGLR